MSTSITADSSDSPGVFNYGIGDTEFIIIVVVCSAAGLLGIIITAICWYKMHYKSKSVAEDAHYSSAHISHKRETMPPGYDGYKMTLQGDRKLAQSAQMYHYQHQKQQMIALEKASSETKQNVSDEDSDTENKDGDYTVYECSGLAPAGEMEVRNPLFQVSPEVSNVSSSSSK